MTFQIGGSFTSGYSPYHFRGMGKLFRSIKFIYIIIRPIKRKLNYKWCILNTSNMAPIKNSGLFTPRLFIFEDGVRIFFTLGY